MFFHRWQRGAEPHQASSIASASSPAAGNSADGAGSTGCAVGSAAASAALSAAGAEASTAGEALAWRGCLEGRNILLNIFLSFWFDVAACRRRPPPHANTACNKGMNRRQADVHRQAHHFCLTLLDCLRNQANGRVPGLRMRRRRRAPLVMGKGLWGPTSCACWTLMLVSTTTTSVTTR